MNEAFTISPTAIGIAILLFIVGAALGWFWSAMLVRQLTSRIRELEAEGGGRRLVEAELRRQTLELKVERDGWREKFDQETQRRVSVETADQKARENVEEQKNLLDQARVQLSDAFSAIASEALGKSSAQFLDLANAKFESLRGESLGDLDQRKVAIEGMVRPLGESLGNLNDRLSQVESSRQEAYGELRSQVQQLAESSKELRVETGALANSLKQPQVKGRWGELTLRRAVELAGMTSHCDFDRQQSVHIENGNSQRPDVIVHLTGGRQIVVDAKVPLHAFLAAAAARDPEEREEALINHARLMREHIQSLSRKEYWKQFQPTPEYVILFVPGESFFSAALEKRPTLIEEASSNHVMLASPTTLIALLYAVAYGWRQGMLVENAEKISAIGKDLYDRLSVFAEYLGDVGRSLERANEAYTKSVRSFNSRLMPGANKFRELGVTGSKEIEALEPVGSLLEPVAPPAADCEAMFTPAPAARAASASGS